MEDILNNIVGIIYLGLASDKKLRDIAELLCTECKAPAPENMVCLGPVRGSAARLLFHTGPNNRLGDMYRDDHEVALRCLGAKRVLLVLQTNRPYSYLRMRRSEVEPLVEALRQSFGTDHEHLTFSLAWMSCLGDKAPACPR